MKDLKNKELPGTDPAMQAEIDRRRNTLHAIGFRPAYFDCATFTLHPARSASAQSAQGRIPDGLPDEAAARSRGEVIPMRPTLVAGFERNGYFYTLAAAWHTAQELGCAV